MRLPEEKEKVEAHQVQEGAKASIYVRAAPARVQGPAWQKLESLLASVRGSRLKTDEGGWRGKMPL